VPEYLKLSLVGQALLGGATEPWRRFGASSDKGEGYQPLRPVRAVHEPGRNLAGPVPAAQGRPRGARIGGRALEGHPVRIRELSVQLDLPVVQPVFPVHDLKPSPENARGHQTARGPARHLQLPPRQHINTMVLTCITERRTLMFMFERFTNRARHSVVLAQEEARRLNHNYIGTEHLLLGLLGEPDGLAARALRDFGVSADGARRTVTAVIGTGSAEPSGHIPFTPRAKKTLELALREALQLRHNYIGTEHILLGLIREGDGVAAQVLKEHADLLAIRMAVLDLLPTATIEATLGRHWLRRRAVTDPGEAAAAAGQAVLNATPAADTTLSEAARLAGSQPVGSHHLLLAALADPDTAAARALAALGVDLDQAKQALRGADVTGTSDEPPEEAGRRQMAIKVTGEQLTIEATDPVIIEAGRAALQALGDQADPPGTIRGGLPACATLSTVWQALHDSLEAIQRRAALHAQPEKPGKRGKPAAEAG
jgi:Clp amino terminal domain, pathogenicity island component